LENRRLLTAAVAVYPLEYDGGLTEGVAASSTSIWVTEQSGSLASIDPVTQVATQYNIPTPNSGPTAIALGPDKNSMWFLETTANQVGEINLTTDAITEYPLLDTANAGLSGITAGPADEVWFTESNANKVGMIDTQTGAISEFPLPGTSAKPKSITYGPDGNLWIADAGANQLVSFNPITHVATVHSIGGTTNDALDAITVGPDQNIWFTETAANAIGMFNLTTQKFATAISLGSGAEPMGIAAGPDGNIWVTETQVQNQYSYGCFAVYKLATGKVTPFVNQDLYGVALGAITSGPGTSKDLWASGGSAGEAAEVSTAGTTTTITLPTTVDDNQVPTSIVSDLNGNIWFTLPGDFEVGVFDPKTDLSTEFSLESLTGSPDPMVIALDSLTGMLWFVAATDNGYDAAIGEVNPNTDTITMGATVPSSNPNAAPGPTSITFDPKDGYFWFTDEGEGSDARGGGGNTALVAFNPVTGAFTENVALPSGSIPGGIVADDNGNLWFTQADLDVVGELGEYNLKTSQLTNYSFETDATQESLAVDANGNLWLNQLLINDAITEINPASGAVITTVPDDNLWFPETSYPGGVTGIGTYNLTSGQSAFYPVPHGYADYVTAGEDGNLWFSGSGNDGYVVGSIGLTAATQASNLSIVAQPSNVTAGDGFGLVVAVDHSSGVLDTFYQGTVTLSLATDPSGDSKLGGTLTATVVNGKAVFAGLTLSNAGTGYVIEASTSGITSATTQPFNVALAANHLVVTQEPPTTVAAGTEFTTIVSAVDGNGSVDGSFDQAITLSLLNNTYGATLGGTVTEGADGGVATFTDLTVSEPGDNFALQATGSTFVAAQSVGFDVTAPPATELSITTAPSSSLVAGTEFNLVVDAMDPEGFIDSAYDGAITLVLSGGPSGARLFGTLTVYANQGVADFTYLTLDLVGSGYTINVSSGSLTGVATGHIAVTAGAVSQFVVTQEPTTSIIAGMPFPLQPIIEEEDDYGNLETGDSSTIVTVTITGGGVGLVGTTSIRLAGGMGSFINLSDDIVGAVTLEYSNNVISTVDPTIITVSPAAAYKLIVEAGYSQTGIAGIALGYQPIVEETDQYGNVETADNTTIVIVSLASGTGSLVGTTDVTVIGGVAFFSGLGDQTADTITFSFTSGTLIAGTSEPIVISPSATETKLGIGGTVFTTETAGLQFSPAPVIYIEDQYGNVETSDNSTQVSVTIIVGSGTLHGTTTVTVVNGAATFDDIYIDVSGSITLSFASENLTSVTTVVIINPVPTNSSSTLEFIGTLPVNVTAGQLLTPAPVVEIFDQYGKLEITDNSTEITVIIVLGGGKLEGVTTATVIDGVATFNDICDTLAGTITLSFGTGSLASVTTVVTINPVATGGSSTLEVIGSLPVSVTAGQILSPAPVIEIVDQYGNLETGDNITQITVVINEGNGSLQGVTTVRVIDGVATFDDIYDTVAGTITLGFGTAGLASVTSVITINPVATSGSSTIELIGTLPLTVLAGQILSPVPAIEIFDQYGNLETTDNITRITVVIAEGDGTLHGTTTVTVVDGVATFNDIYDTLAGTITLSFGTGSVASVTTVITIDPAAPSDLSTLVLLGTPPVTVTAGQVLSPAPVIEIFDEYGNLETNDSTTQISVVIAVGPDRLQGVTTVTVEDGLATFSDLYDTVADTITLSFGFGTVTPVTTVVTIEPVATGASSHLEMMNSQAIAATAGVAFNPVPVVEILDQYGNLETNDNATQVSVVLISGGGTLAGASPVTVANGVATFSGLSDTTAGLITLRFGSDSFSSVVMLNGTITPVPTNGSSTLTIRGPIPMSVIAGQILSPPPVIELLDQYGNVETGDSATQISVSVAGGSGTLQGATTVTVVNGVATFTGIAEEVARNLSLIFSFGSQASVTSGTISVSPDSADKLVIEAEPSTSAVAGQAFGQQPVVVVEDQYGNIEIGDYSTVVTAQIAGGGLLQSTSTATAVGGITSFEALADDKAQTMTLSLTSGSLIPAITTPVSVVAGAATQLVLTTPPPNPVTAGQTFGEVVSAEDGYGNVDTSYDGSVTITLPGNSGSSTVQATNGVALFSGLKIDSTSGGSGIQTTTSGSAIIVSGGGIGSVSSQPVTVVPPIVVPVVMAEQVVDTQKKNKKGKAVGKPVFTDFALDFNVSLNAGTAENAANYELFYMSTKRVKKRTVMILNRVPITAAYNPVTNVVTLTLVGKQAFAKGGGITVIGSQSGGITSAAGAMLYPSETFVILPKAAGIQPGS
jgi:streptogramin lyase